MLIMQSLVSPYERLLCKRPLLPASAFFLLAREARVEPGLARHSDPFALGAIPLLRCSSDAAAGMSQKRDTGLWSILTGTHAIDAHSMQKTHAHNVKPCISLRETLVQNATFASHCILSTRASGSS